MIVILLIGFSLVGIIFYALALDSSSVNIFEDNSSFMYDSDNSDNYKNK